MFGKGVGFLRPPAEVPLSRIERTFYDLDHRYISLFNDVPKDVIDFTARLMDEVRPRLPYETNASLVLTLSDHLAFAMERVRRGIYVPMPPLYEMENAYPLEIDVGRRFVSELEKCFHIRLPKGEVQGVAMHFINARSGKPDNPQQPGIESRIDEIMERITQIIEHDMGVEIERGSFDYARFATHMQYLLKRAFDHRHIDSDNIQMYRTIRDEYETVSGSVDRICRYLESNWSMKLNEEEKLYLIMHVNRVCARRCTETD